MMRSGRGGSDNDSHNSASSSVADDAASHHSPPLPARDAAVGKTSDTVLPMNFATRRSDVSYHPPPTKRRSSKRNSKVTQELMQMTLQQREDINEEIHGVKSLAVPETAELITQSLASMEQAINTQVQQLQQQRRQQHHSSIRPSSSSAASSPLPAYLEARQMGNLLINQPAFRLKFLRAALFNTTVAAEKFLGFLQLLRDILGQEALMKLPTFSLNHFTFDEHALLREGRFQILPGRDRVGRRMVGVFDDFGTTRSHVAKFRVALYVLLAASEDIDTQKKGLVTIHFHSSPASKQLSQPEEREMFHKLCETLPLRVSAAHVCLPNDESEKFAQFKTWVTDSVGNETRKRLRFHYGSPTKLHCELETFGISADMIPINSNTGSLKTQNFTKWINMRLAREEQMARAANAAVAASAGRIDAVTAAQQYVFPWIECPTQQDVLLGRGRPIMNHKGNVAMRELVGLNLGRFNATTQKHERANIIEEVVQSIKAAGGRFLREDPNMNGFWAVVDDKAARQKVGIYFRDLRCSTGGSTVAIAPAAAAAKSYTSSTSSISYSASSSLRASPSSLQDAAQGSAVQDSSKTEQKESPSISGKKRSYNADGE